MHECGTSLLVLGGHEWMLLLMWSIFCRYTNSRKSARIRLLSAFCHCTYAIYIWQPFLLVRTVRSYVNVIKLPNPINKTAILTILIIAKFETVEESDFWQSAKAPHGCYLWMAITIIVIIKIICMSRHQKGSKVAANP
jgi:hypothetical protein